MQRRRFLLSALSLPALAGPLDVVPSARQLRWHRLETYAFLHFTTNTFTDLEWGYGDESPSIFNPTAFDADRICADLKAGGMKAVILTCKHHDGFCLWPTKTTPHNVSASPFRNGKGDVVRELSEAAAKAGLLFGVYLSPWDRNSALYATPEYVELYRAQLTELLTNYGPIFEVWHDGANGGDGYYGGAKEKRKIDKKTYYGWPKTWDLVRKLQPEAVIFSDVGPDVRWVGNEKGFAAETSWARFSPVAENGGEASPGDVKAKESMAGHRDGRVWMPAECDVSIRPGWFWHEKENAKVRSPKNLMELYFQSVGRGGSFLLNIPPDRRGLLHEADVASLTAFGEAVRKTFATNLLAGAETSANELLDNNLDTYWTNGRAVPEVEFRLKSPVSFNVIRLREAIAYGQRVGGFAVDGWKDGGWTELAQGTSVGNCRLIRLPKSAESARFRLRIVDSESEPMLSEFGLYNEA